MYFEQMRPDELRRQQRASNMVFLPVGPLEWHGPHLPVGTDGLIARAMAERLAGYFGAALLPILYAGGADVLSPAVRQDLGLPENSGSVRGMDFAPGGFPSIYLREST